METKAPRQDEYDIDDIVERYQRHQKLLKYYTHGTLRVFRDAEEDNDIFRLRDEGRELAIIFYLLHNKISAEHLDLSFSDLRGIKASRNTGLESSLLCDANLQGANLFGIDLRRAKLCRANLSGVIFYDTRLFGADLRETIGLTEEQILSAIIDKDTLLDPKFNAVKNKRLAELALDKANDEWFKTPKAEPTLG